MTDQQEREAFEAHRVACVKAGKQLPHWDEFDSFKAGMASMQAKADKLRADMERLHHSILAHCVSIGSDGSSAATNITPDYAKIIAAHDAALKRKHYGECMGVIKGNAFIQESNRMSSCSPDGEYDLGYQDSASEALEAIKQAMEASDE